jgi:Zn-dependent protease
VVRVRVDRGGAVIVAAVLLIGLGTLPEHPAAGLQLGVLTALSLLLHECGHMLAAQFLGVKVHEIGLCLKGSYIRRDRAKEALDDAMISLCGPMLNALVAAAMWTTPGVGHWLAIYNLVLMASNLAPLPGSDGMRIVLALKRRAATTAIADGILQLNRLDMYPSAVQLPFPAPDPSNPENSKLIQEESRWSA